MDDTFLEKKNLNWEESILYLNFRHIELNKMNSEMNDQNFGVFFQMPIYIQFYITFISCYVNLHSPQT